MDNDELARLQHLEAMVLPRIRDVLRPGYDSWSPEARLAELDRIVAAARRKAKQEIAETGSSSVAPGVRDGKGRPAVNAALQRLQNTADEVASLEDALDAARDRLRRHARDALDAGATWTSVEHAAGRRRAWISKARKP